MRKILFIIMQNHKNKLKRIVQTKKAFDERKIKAVNDTGNREEKV